MTRACALLLAVTGCGGDPFTLASVPREEAGQAAVESGARARIDAGGEAGDFDAGADALEPYDAGNATTPDSSAGGATGSGGATCNAPACPPCVGASPCCTERATCGCMGTVFLICQ